MKPHIPIKFQQCSVFVILIFFLTIHHSFAQVCNAPTNATTVITDATCIGNGIVNVTNVTVTGAENLQYALYNQADNTVYKNYQDSARILQVEKGTYMLRVKNVCVNGQSTEFKKLVTVGGNYTAPNITAINILRKSQCDNGEIRVVASGGTGTSTFSYALISAQNLEEPLDPANIIRPRQSSPTFTGLPPGTYYARVYDACNSHVTANVILPGHTPASVLTSVQLQYNFCDLLNLRVYVSNLNDYVAGATRQVKIMLPDSTYITKAYTNGTLVDFPIPITSLGVVDATKSWPENITLPISFDVELTDECGVVYKTKTTFATATLSLDIEQVNSTDPLTCTSDYIRVGMQSNVNQTSGGGNFNQVMFPDDAQIKYGDGPWQDFATGASLFSTSFFFPADAVNKQICIRVCGQEYCKAYVPAVNGFNLSLREANLNSCAGNSGIQLSRSNSSSKFAPPYTVTVLSAPLGVNIAPFSWTGTTVVPDQFENIPIGTYRISVADNCGIVREQTITLTRPLEQFTASYQYLCGNTNLRINIANDQYYTGTGNGNSAQLAGKYRARVYQTDGVTPVTTTFNSVIGSGITVTESIPDGQYIIRIWKNLAETCPIELPWEKGPETIVVSNVLVAQNCPTSPSSNTIIATAGYGVLPYSYSLYKGSYAPENRLVAFQTSNVFTNITDPGPYVIFVQDACGRGIQGTVSTDVAGLKVSNNAGGTMPCPDSDLTLSMLYSPDVTYQWYKDGVAIANATLHTFTIADIEIGDKGLYEVEMSMGTCPIIYRAFDLDPAQCAQPLPVELVSFDVRAVNSEKSPVVKLDWITSEEVNNHGFTIERSPDGKHWSELGFVLSKSQGGNSATNITYDFFDKNPLVGTTYYRLRQDDFDKTATYSVLRVIKIEGVPTMVMSPNPTTGKFKIESNLANGIKSVSIRDMLGVELMHIEVKTSHKSEIDISKLPGGLYLGVVTDENGNKNTIKIVKY